MRDPDCPRIAREDIAPEHGQRIVVRCDRPGCHHATLLDPRPMFGWRRDWPAEGRSNRFHCRCGHREAIVSYTRHPDAPNGPLSADALRLWF